MYTLANRAKNRYIYIPNYQLLELSQSNEKLNNILQSNHFLEETFFSSFEIIVWIRKKTKRVISLNIRDDFLLKRSSYFL